MSKAKHMVYVVSDDNNLHFLFNSAGCPLYFSQKACGRATEGKSSVSLLVGESNPS